MSHSFTNLLYHIVFSTKNRENWLVGEIGTRLFAYMGGLIRKQGGIALCVNGVPDHVHVLAKLRQDTALSHLVRHIKAHSSLWFHQTIPNGKGFAWQTGYGAFTVSGSQVEVVRQYILHQEEHHRHRTYQDEFRLLLRRHGVAYREEDLWD